MLQVPGHPGCEAMLWSCRAEGLAFLLACASVSAPRHEASWTTEREDINACVSQGQTWHLSGICSLDLRVMNICLRRSLSFSSGGELIRASGSWCFICNCKQATLLPSHGITTQGEGEALCVFWGTRESGVEV
jgi:hypothetical protein